ncbi:MAG: UDP-N-acetylglucosamine--N-acetylmuramyl-(pentapeptide) pyrophosphoryl-undecaprenol N-acetylglucosamine transferase [Oscillospiraceae bacterium]|nr:UDP-N-acetylglucosamine--N-acetylmuramyl-(pentapeptide) pyrophosphoryl-undecaprenol N-acetylglucosamine transferase [Oscillospiraceae bacterium]
MKFVLTCGGTAGHINPALAVAGRLRELFPESEFLFLGAEGKMEMLLVPKAGYEIRALPITNISRGKSLGAVLHNVDTVKNVLLSRRLTHRILKEFKPDAVIGTGGYVCYPVLMEAAAMHIPTAVHESNAVPGLTTRMLAEHVDRIFLGFEESRNHYPRPEKLSVTGTPVRGEFARYTKAAAKAQLGLEPDQKLVVSVWGSLGSGMMNDIFCRMLPLLRGQKDFRLIHAIGSRDYRDVCARIREEGLEPSDCGADAREYIFDMPRVMAAADLLLCRAGASTLSELSYMGKPAILIPSPNVTNHHQEKNARVLEQAGAARVLLEGEFDENSLLALVKELLADETRLNAMSAASASLAVPDATDKICGEILDLIPSGQKKHF